MPRLRIKPATLDFQIQCSSGYITLPVSHWPFCAGQQQATQTNNRQKIQTMKAFTQISETWARTQQQDRRAHARRPDTPPLSLAGWLSQ